MPVTGADGVMRFGRPLDEVELRQVRMQNILDGFGDDSHGLDHPVHDGIDENGLIAAITPEEARKHAVTCIYCGGDELVQASCDHCAGRGVVMSVPYPDRPWDLIVGSGRGGETPAHSVPLTSATANLAGGLWLGGHLCQEGAEACFPRDKFDAVISLHKSSKYAHYEPTNGARCLDYSLPDAVLHPSHHAGLALLAAKAVHYAQGGKQVLIRCRAGINRSGLVMGLALLRLGYTPDEALFMMRRARSPYVMFNDSFVAFLDDAHRRGSLAQ